MIGNMTFTTKACLVCFRANAVAGKTVDGRQACSQCWRNDRAAAKRRGKMRPGVCATVNASLPQVKHVASLPGQLDLFGEGV